MLELLASHGSNVNYRDNGSQLTILHHACAKNNIKAVKCLISHGADLNMLNSGGYSVIHFAIFSTVRGISVKSFGPDFVNESEVIDLIELLLSNGANVNLKNEDGYTPLHMASFMSTRGIVETLISHGAEINSLTKDGYTPLDLADGREKIHYEKYLRLRNAKMDYQYYLDSSQEASKIVALLKLHGGKSNSGDISMTKYLNISHYLNI
ncbi:hypothetical protein TVAG_494880 [Trichomonas vaginalis G3]|uniref:Uncharacterized protein n=1 Tax=Trichomonas vaginalis (strain ATCC PRA-98 / G3) TaxID=412133 RepID=A2EXT5_TRIV3|nr:spectrin binding [Trichomonas vaginalis G3]EAY02539.1 hypothetical protein TVAG_494880 [Trichomonas vaginalis G3]KAI5506031.1 spectrin binding [Trichomonas vaginalis G3]|eukprot:XP_001314778.1 hypothetical protein [Trichomonas vaginalis G3]